MTLGLLLISAVLVSSVVDQIVPKVSLPLIQIALGVAIALLASSEITISLDPELFLVLFIAPLLYDEAKTANKSELWSEIRPVLSLAVGLVVVTALVIGFALNLIIPSIPLAAAFALGAALGPTDAVAVTSLAKQVDIPKRQKSILKGELLLNDASGIVSFQFALAAVVTGSFSLMNASIEFVIEFLGGLVVGVGLGLLFNLIVRAARSIGLENTTFHVLFEVLTPFLVFLVSDAIHVSGIIAVVVAGLLNVISPRTVDPSVSRMNIVSSNVWHVLAFCLNGIVFVLLGTQLPGAMRRTWDDISFDNGFLLLCILGITLLLYGVRFLWVLIMDRRYVKTTLKRPFEKKDAKLALITTLCGAKGTITLSILFTIPYAITLDPFTTFPQRDLIIFLACGVILCTLLVATFIVPLLAPRAAEKESELQRRQREAECHAEILRNVIEDLTSRQNDENRAATQIVIQSYNDRLASVKEHHDFEVNDPENVELRVQTLRWEQERTFELMEADRVAPIVGYKYLARLSRLENLLKHDSSLSWIARLWTRSQTLLRRGLMTIVRELPDTSLTEQAEGLRKLQIETESFVIDKLEEIIGSGDSSVLTEDASALLLEFQHSRRVLMQRTASVSKILDIEDKVSEVRRTALRIELERIQAMRDEDRLSRATAKRLRENVTVMQMDLENNL